jgi:hypothetical protein
MVRWSLAVTATSTPITVARPAFGTTTNAFVREPMRDRHRAHDVSMAVRDTGNWKKGDENEK